MFAEAHGFDPGDSVSAIINGKLQKLKMVGNVLTPEYVIQIQGGSILPDKKRFGIFWMNERELESAFDMSGAFNSVSLKLAHGANSQEVIAQLDQLLEPYGSIGAYDRSEQLSHQYVTDELFQLRTMATIAPAIFLSVAAFLLNIVISRIISQQREQIAALKAFGYTNYEVGFHYLNLVLIISVTGTIVGTLFGFWMAVNLTEMYQEFYKFPLLAFKINMLGGPVGVPVNNVCGGRGNLVGGSQGDSVAAGRSNATRTAAQLSSDHRRALSAVRIAAAGAAHDHPQHRTQAVQVRRFDHRHCRGGFGADPRQFFAGLA